MNADAREQVLARSSVFAHVPRDDRAALAELMNTESFSAKSVVMEAGEPADCVYVVAEGTLSVFLPGSTQKIRTLRVGDVLGEYGILAGSVRSTTVHADEPAVLLSLEYDRFREYLLRSPTALWVLFEDAVRRLLAAEAAQRRPQPPS
jgi:CRP-like cAMP-binding protein